MFLKHKDQNLSGGSVLIWVLKFRFFSCRSLPVSLTDSTIDSANVFPKILLAITRRANPVYPGIGFSSLTYYFPSWKAILELPKG